MTLRRDLIGDARGIDIAFLTILEEYAKNVTGKGDRTSQRLQELSRTLIKILDRSDGTSSVQIYGRHVSKSISMSFWVGLSKDWVIQVERTDMGGDRVALIPISLFGVCVLL